MRAVPIMHVVGHSVILYVDVEPSLPVLRKLSTCSTKHDESWEMAWVLKILRIGEPPYLRLKKSGS